MKGIALVVITVVVFPFIFGAIYGWPFFLKGRWDALRRRQGKAPVQFSFRALFGMSLGFGVWSYLIGYMLVDDGNRASGIIIILLGMPAWMFVIFGGINEAINWLTKKGGP